jgi:hypothetical protein
MLVWKKPDLLGRMVFPDTHMVAKPTSVWIGACPIMRKGQPAWVTGVRGRAKTQQWVTQLPLYIQTINKKGIFIFSKRIVQKIWFLQNDFFC